MLLIMMVYFSAIGLTRRDGHIRVGICCRSLWRSRPETAGPACRSSVPGIFPGRHLARHRLRQGIDPVQSELCPFQSAVPRLGCPIDRAGEFCADQPAAGFAPARRQADDPARYRGISMSILLVCLILSLLIIGVPVGFALWLSGLVFVIVTGATSLTQVAQSIYSALDSFVLLAVPFFILAGNIMLRSGFATHLFAFMQKPGRRGSGWRLDRGHRRLCNLRRDDRVIGCIRGGPGSHDDPYHGSAGLPAPLHRRPDGGGGDARNSHSAERCDGDLCRTVAAIGQEPVSRRCGAGPS